MVRLVCPINVFFTHNSGIILTSYIIYINMLISENMFVIFLYMFVAWKKDVTFLYKYGQVKVF